MNKRAHIFFSGRVQGVFFRDHTQKLALSLGLKGWVRNLPDGRVETLVEGDEESILTLITKMKKGPPLARVDSVHTEWEDYLGEFSDFQITW